jgi:phosphoribosylamine-glycine ligase
VVTITAVAAHLDEARRAAYESASRVRFRGAWHRTDIGEGVS